MANSHCSRDWSQSPCLIDDHNACELSGSAQSDAPITRQDRDTRLSLVAQTTTYKRISAPISARLRCRCFGVASPRLYYSPCDRDGRSVCPAPPSASPWPLKHRRERATLPSSGSVVELAVRRRMRWRRRAAGRAPHQLRRDPSDRDRRVLAGSRDARGRAGNGPVWYGDRAAG